VDFACELTPTLSPRKPLRFNTLSSSLFAPAGLTPAFGGQRSTPHTTPSCPTGNAHQRPNVSRQVMASQVTASKHMRAPHLAEGQGTEQTQRRQLFCPWLTVHFQPRLFPKNFPKSLAAQADFIANTQGSSPGSAGVAVAV